MTLKPLRELIDSKDEAEQHAASLLTRAKVPDATEPQKRRVLANIRYHQVSAQRSRMTHLLVPMFLILAGTAAAAIGRWKASDDAAAPGPTATPQTVSSVTVVTPKNQSASNTVPAPIAPSLNSKRPADPAPGARSSPAPEATEPLAAPQGRAAASMEAPSIRAAGAAPASLVSAAMSALRVSREPKRALELLEQYFSRYPGGPLEEEGLALAMEASVATGNGQAERYAKRYLTRFPNGQFAKTARKFVRASN